MISSVDTGCLELDTAARCWLEWNVAGSADSRAVEKLLEEKKIGELKKILCSRLKFGTAGIRAKMGPGFARMNDLVIIQTTQGLVQYVLKSSLSKEDAQRRGAVIGFDGRHNSSRWARLAACVFLRAGVNVRLFSRITPTPWVPFTVQREKAAVGVMVTASHNPKEDNGYKVYWSNGPQITPPHDVNIHESILCHQTPSAGDDSFDESYLTQFGAKTSPQLVDPLAVQTQEYLKTLDLRLFDPAMNRAFDENIVYTAMHGVGADYLDQAFDKAGFQPVLHVKEQRDPDPDFPTVRFPNPEEGKSALDLAMQLAEKAGSNFIIANDPDADRLAIAELNDGKWKVFTGDEMGALLGWWQLQVHTKHHPGEDKSTLYYVASTVSSKMLRSIAKQEGMSFEETLTGFKWMANKAYDLEREGNKVLLAYEESIGYMCDTTVLDKDGISGAVRAAELRAYLHREGKTLAGKLKDLYETYGYHYGQVSYLTISDHCTADRMFERLRNFDGKPGTYPRQLGSYPIASVRDLNTGLDSSQMDGKATLPMSKDSQMITFLLENGVVLTVRTSGTEPKLKYYAEYCAKPEQTNWKSVEEELDSIVALLIENFIQPKIYGLIPRSA